MNAKLEMNPEEMKKTRRKIENGILRLSECVNPNEVLWLLTEVERLTTSENEWLQVAAAANTLCAERADEIEKLRAEVAWLKSGLIDLESAESSVDDLMMGNDKLKEEVERLNKRDCNATVELCYATADQPFEREQLQVVDVGVSSNVYVVESAVLTHLQIESKILREALKMSYLEHQSDSAGEDVDDCSCYLCLAYLQALKEVG